MLITLTTDFGSGSSYVAALKGALLSANEDVHIVDLTHDLPPQDLIATAYFLAETLPYFPAGSSHIVVVDPGVGTERALLCVEWNGSHILAPDNGCWTSLIEADQAPPTVYRLAEPRYWRPRISPTFHGRDILAPVAVHLSLGVAPAQLGPRVQDFVRLSLPRPVASAGVIRGQVVCVDRFGNLITNIRGSELSDKISVGDTATDRIRVVKCYGEAEPGTLVALIGSNGFVEVAVVNGSAAARLKVGVGAAVVVRPA